jgi:diguanylate cyclase (GGDEF)-like protein
VPWREFLLWGIGLLVVASGLWAVMRAAAEAELAHDAEDVALYWARLAAAAVPGLEDALADRGLSGETHAALLRLTQDEEVFRFKLFTSQGKQVLVSDDLAPRPAGGPTLPQSASTAAAHGVPPQVLAGEPYVVLKRSTQPNRPPIFSEAYVPIVRDGRHLGIVEVYVDQRERAARNERAYAEVGLLVAALLSALGGLGFWQWYGRLQRQRRAEERVHYLAHHDPLSGTLNRVSFSEAVRQAEWRQAQGGPGFAVMCIDLDRFKEVNDGFGHSAGDEVLRQVGARLRALIRKGDEIARLGGDEFALLQGGVAQAQDTTTLAQRIVDALAEPYELGGRQTVVCGASVGIAIHGVDGNGTEELMHKADLALYRAKAAGRGQYSFYDAALDEQLQRRRELTQELRDALHSDGLALFYQPLYGSDGRTLHGYEALLRWPHARRGHVPPTEFIPLAEDSGLIDPLGRWVLDQACREATRWPEALRVSVNLSPAQFRHGDVVALVRDTLAASGLAPDRLELEITESLLMSNTDRVLRTLHALSGLGVRIAMDDFGTGYSSLAYLWRVPFDKVKIDRAFTRGLGEDPKVALIVKSIISLAHSLRIRVNAEGVETPVQLAALREHGCDEMQGFLLGRPAPSHALGHGAPSTAAAESPADRLGAGAAELVHRA